MQIIERIVSSVGRRIDESQPDGGRAPAGRLARQRHHPAAGARRPGAVDPPVPDRSAGGAQDLVERESLTQPMLDFLNGGGAQPAEHHRLGRHRRRQDDAAQHPVELHLGQRAHRHDRGRGRTDAAAAPRRAPRDASAEHRRQAARCSARDLVINALRMRPDRIVVGEVRGAEALDMLQAMNTGHDGSLTTIHANTPRDALYRLDTMVAMANLNIPERADPAADCVGGGSRRPGDASGDGTRKVTAISEITGMEGDVITMQDIFLFEKTRPVAGRPG